jgi:hypothetical protein
MRANVTLYTATLHLYAALLEQEVPDGSEWRDGLLEAAEALHVLAARVPRKPDPFMQLHELAEATRRCLDRLEGVDVRMPLVRHAWRCLRVVVEELEAELDSFLLPALN